MDIEKLKEKQIRVNVELNLLDLIIQNKIKYISFKNDNLSFGLEGEDEVDSEVSQESEHEIKCQTLKSLDQIPDGIKTFILDRNRIDREYTLNQVFDLLKKRVLRQVNHKPTKKELLLMSEEFVQSSDMVQDIYDRYNLKECWKFSTFKLLLSMYNRSVRNKICEVREFFDNPESSVDLTKYKVL